MNETLKIAVTVCDCSHVLHAGGDPHRVTSIIELADNQIPQILREYLKRFELRQESANAPFMHESVSLSLVQE